MSVTLTTLYSSADRSTVHIDVELLEQPSLVGLRAYGRECRDLALQKLRLINCDVGSDFSGSSFVQVSMSKCRFAYSRLIGTLWQEARIEETSFRGCDFLDAQIGDAMFVDCDFHGARIDSALANATNARFIRCNLTDAKWERDLGPGIHLINCHGVGPALQPSASTC